VARGNDDSNTKLTKIYCSLATIFYGINDYAALQEGPGSLEEAAKELLKQTERLISVGLTHFIVLSKFREVPTIRNVHMKRVSYSELNEVPVVHDSSLFQQTRHQQLQ
jgi:hypothetical protein